MSQLLMRIIPLFLLLVSTLQINPALGGNGLSDDSLSGVVSCSPFYERLFNSVNLWRDQRQLVRLAGFSTENAKRTAELFQKKLPFKSYRAGIQTIRALGRAYWADPLRTEFGVPSLYYLFRLNPKLDSTSATAFLKFFPDGNELRQVLKEIEFLIASNYLHKNTATELVLGRSTLSHDGRQAVAIALNLDHRMQAWMDIDLWRVVADQKLDWLSGGTKPSEEAIRIAYDTLTEGYTTALYFQRIGANLSAESTCGATDELVDRLDPSVQSLIESGNPSDEFMRQHAMIQYLRFLPK